MQPTSSSISQRLKVLSLFAENRFEVHPIKSENCVKSHCSSMSLAERHGHTWICRAQVKPNWAFKTRTTIQK